MAQTQLSARLHARTLPPLIDSEQKLHLASEHGFKEAWWVCEFLIVVCAPVCVCVCVCMCLCVSACVCDCVCLCVESFLGVCVSLWILYAGKKFGCKAVFFSK